MIRAVAGAWAVPVGVSEWLFLCTMLLALFLGISKRRAELVAVTTGRKVGRPILSEYSAELLDQMSDTIMPGLIALNDLYTLYDSISDGGTPPTPNCDHPVRHLRNISMHVSDSPQKPGGGTG